MGLIYNSQRIAGAYYNGAKVNAYYNNQKVFNSQEPLGTLVAESTTLSGGAYSLNYMSYGYATLGHQSYNSQYINPSGAGWRTLVAGDYRLTGQFTFINLPTSITEFGLLASYGNTVPTTIISAGKYVYNETKPVIDGAVSFSFNSVVALPVQAGGDNTEQLMFLKQNSTSSIDIGNYVGAGIYYRMYKL
jgi:hypothetical protein